MALHRLARDLGMTRGQLLHDLERYGGGTQELIDWEAFQRIEPQGFHMDNFRAGVVAATVANVAPRPRGSKPHKPSDFYPVIGRNSGLTPRQERELAVRAAKRGKKK